MTGWIRGLARSSERRREAAAFTLTELLIVIAIISVLAAMLLPALQQARATAQKAQCMSRLKELTTACFLYAEDYGGYTPRYTDDGSHYYWSWMDFLIHYEYIPWRYGVQVMSGGRPRVSYGNTRAQQRTWGCPAQRYVDAWGNEQIDYGININFQDRRGKVLAPTKLLLLGDSRNNRIWYDPGDRTYRHFGGENFSFYDGHVAWWNRYLLDKYVSLYHSNKLPLMNSTVYVGTNAAEIQ